MQGASFVSARDEMGRDHGVRELIPPAGEVPTRVTTHRLARRLVMLITLTKIIAGFFASVTPKN
jgi:hypothetical protein